MTKGQPKLPVLVSYISMYLVMEWVESPLVSKCALNRGLFVHKQYFARHLV